MGKIVRMQLFVNMLEAYFEELEQSFKIEDILFQDIHTAHIIVNSNKKLLNFDIQILSDTEVSVLLDNKELKVSDSLAKQWKAFILKNNEKMSA